MFSGDTERDQWHKMGKGKLSFFNFTCPWWEYSPLDELNDLEHKYYIDTVKQHCKNEQEAIHTMPH